MKNKKNRIFNIIKYIFSLFLILLILLIVNTKKGKTIDKEKIDALKPLDQEGQNYRLVTSADNVQVPVPKGYVASQVAGENYVTPEYQHTTNTYKGNYTELTWSSPTGEQYPWTQDENGIWISGNQGIPSSTSILESEEFDYIEGTTLTINYTFSCQNSYDKDYLSIYLINLTNNTTQKIVIDKYGNTSPTFDYTTSNYTYTMNDWGTGRYKIRARYLKNASIDEGQDSGYIKGATYFKEDENGETLESDIKTKIHDGGFVIYQLTDEELETDPNGTVVIINDSNKDEAQRTRNQYVWVPVQNVEDIVRTKEANNGIMQFGQNYEFSNTSITKATYIIEPKIAKSTDKTKYYLQKFSKMNKRENYLNNMQEEYTRMTKSINKYKGFYIGRYETGDEVYHDYNTSCFINPKIIRYNENIGYVSWYESYKDLERLSGKTEKYVETGMLHDSLWDYTLKWLNETETRSYADIAVDSETWGNYCNTTITVTEGVIIPSKTGAVETITCKGKTYSDSPTASNNIFDMAGNIWEYTKSSFSDDGIRTRGGYSFAGSYDHPGRSTFGQSAYYSQYSYNGARSMLIIR